MLYIDDKNNTLFLFDKSSNKLIEVDENTLCKKVDEKYYENDVFDFFGYKWIVKYEESMSGYQLTRKDPLIHFTHYLPLSKIKEAKYLGNIIDSPDIIN